MPPKDSSPKDQKKSRKQDADGRAGKKRRKNAVDTPQDTPSPGPSSQATPTQTSEAVPAQETSEPPAGVQRFDEDNEDEEDEDDEEQIAAEDYAFTQEEALRQKELLRALMLHFDEQQMTRYEDYRRSGFSKGSIRRLVNQVLQQTISPSILTVVRGFAKVFVGEIVEQARKIQRDPGPLTPDSLREAYRIYMEDNVGHVGVPKPKIF